MILFFHLYSHQIILVLFSLSLAFYLDDGERGKLAMRENDEDGARGGVGKSLC